MDPNTITAWAAMATAIAACVAPTLTAYIHAKAELKMKQMELFHSRYDSALSEFVKAYSELGTFIDFLQFKQKALELMTCIENKDIRTNILFLVDSVEVHDFKATTDSDYLMEKLIDLLTKSL